MTTKQSKDIEHASRNDFSQFEVIDIPEKSFSIKKYDAIWPQQFQAIKTDLEEDLAHAKLTYKSIEHIGSTSVPGLGSKATTDARSEVWNEAVLDICILVARENFNNEGLEAFKEALLWGPRQGGYYYIGDGGVEDRWSFKIRGVLPLRSLYVVADDSIPLRSYISLRRVLRKDKTLRDEYMRVKTQLAKQYGESAVVYCNHKRPTIRKIFLRDGWTDAEVDEDLNESTSHADPAPAEAKAIRIWEPYTIADFYEADASCMQALMSLAISDPATDCPQR